MVKSFILLFTLLIACNVAVTQTPLSRGEALGQLYRNYDPAKNQAKWACSEDQKSADPAKRRGWICEEGEVVTVSLVLLSEAKEGGDWKTYVVASATPGEDPSQYECHACEPAIGIAVFVWQEGLWQLRSANAAVGFYGQWGGTPICELVSIGSEEHGVLLTTGGGGQGYHGSVKALAAQVGDTVNEVWRLNDETDDSGAFDPTGKDGPSRRYYAEVAFKFVWNGRDEIYDIIAMSRGSDAEGLANWTAVYRYRGGQYQLITKTRYSELRHSSNTSSSTKLKR